MCYLLMHYLLCCLLTLDPRFIITGLLLALFMDAVEADLETQEASYSAWQVAEQNCPLGLKLIKWNQMTDKHTCKCITLKFSVYQNNHTSQNTIFHGAYVGKSKARQTNVSINEPI